MIYHGLIQSVAFSYINWLRSLLVPPVLACFLQAHFKDSPTSKDPITIIPSPQRSQMNKVGFRIRYLVVFSINIIIHKLLFINQEADADR
eukprot:450712-Amphidinium_carterae.1